MEGAEMAHSPIEAETILPQEQFGTELPAKYFWRCASSGQIKQRMPGSLKPQMSYCLSCQQEVLTRVEKHKGKGNLSTCCCLALIGCCCISWLALSSDQFKDSLHFCPLCDASLGLVRFLNDQ